MLNIIPKISENESLDHYPLRFTQGSGIFQILAILEYVHFIAKDNSSELIKEFHYCKNFLLSCSVVTLWLAQYY